MTTENTVSAQISESAQQILTAWYERPRDDDYVRIKMVEFFVGKTTDLTSVKGNMDRLLRHAPEITMPPLMAISARPTTWLDSDNNIIWNPDRPEDGILIYNTTRLNWRIIYDSMPILTIEEVYAVAKRRMEDDARRMIKAAQEFLDNPEDGVCKALTAGSFYIPGLFA